MKTFVQIVMSSTILGGRECLNVFMVFWICVVKIIYICAVKILLEYFRCVCHDG